MGDYAFVVTQVGSKDSSERKRADEVCDHIIEPVLKNFSLVLRRADREATPGQITAQILKLLIDSAVVVADMTGKNPNVYYELAIAHAFGKPVIGLIDDTANVAFDIKDERLIPLGPWSDGFKIAQAEDAKTALAATLVAITSPGYKPTSMVTDVASAQSLEGLAPADPVASELALIRDSLDDMQASLRQQQRQPSGDWAQEDMRQARSLIVRLLRGSPRNALQAVDRSSTSVEFDDFLDDAWQWLEDALAQRQETRASESMREASVVEQRRVRVPSELSKPTLREATQRAAKRSAADKPYDDPKW